MVTNPTAKHDGRGRLRASIRRKALRSLAGVYPSRRHVLRVAVEPRDRGPPTDGSLLEHTVVGWASLVLSVGGNAESSAAFVIVPVCSAATMNSI